MNAEMNAEKILFTVPLPPLPLPTEPVIIVTDEPVANEPPSANETTPLKQVPLKKYRVPNYDIFDEKYANRLCSLYKVPPKFNKFTDGLMDESRINRQCLLTAISDYKKTELYVKFPLSESFQDEAFNFRPYQSCVIS
jgi:hypothetical protein